MKKIKYKFTKDGCKELLKRFDDTCEPPKHTDIKVDLIRDGLNQLLSKKPKTRQYKVYCYGQASFDAFNKAIGEKLKIEGIIK